MQITIDRHYYSYFGGASKHEYKHFANLLEGWNAYKRESAKDFDYGDAWQDTTCFVTLDHTVVAKPQRPHARTKAEWLKLQRFMSDYECKGMKAAYVEQNAYDIMLAYNEAHTSPFDAFDEDFML